jgi:hypothetical protein
MAGTVGLIGLGNMAVALNLVKAGFELVVCVWPKPISRYRLLPLQIDRARGGIAGIHSQEPAHKSAHIFRISVVTY